VVFDSEFSQHFDYARRQNSSEATILNILTHENSQLNGRDLLSRTSEGTFFAVGGSCSQNLSIHQF